MTGGFSRSTDLHSPGAIGDVTPGSVKATTVQSPTVYTPNTFRRFSDDNPTFVIADNGCICATAFSIGTGYGLAFSSTDPHVVGQWWDNGTILLRSAG